MLSFNVLLRVPIMLGYSRDAQQQVILYVHKHSLVTVSLDGRVHVSDRHQMQNAQMK